MGKSDSSKMNILTGGRAAQSAQPSRKKKPNSMNAMSRSNTARFVAPRVKTEMLQIIAFLEELSDELEDVEDLSAPNPNLRMTLLLLRGHLEGRVITATALIGASRVPYATANRRLKEMLDAGLIEQRPRTKTGKSFSMHPSEILIDQWSQLSSRVGRSVVSRFGAKQNLGETEDYYFGESYMDAKSIPPLQLLSEPLKLAGGLRVLVHGDPTFMVMNNLKRQFEHSIGTQIHQRAFSIDRLHDEAVRNADRKASRYDVIAVDLPWVGEFAERGVLMPLDEAMDIASVDPADFHTAGWKAAHWGGKPYGLPAQTTPELLFYRKDMLSAAGLEPPATTDALLAAAKALHDPQRGRHGIAWNAARGTALGHTVLMTLADFGQPILDLPPDAGGFATSHLADRRYNVTIDTEAGLRAAEFLVQLLEYSPPDILSMSWYERVRPYAAGRVAMAYGYTLLAPYFELDEDSPANGQTGYLPHPAGPGANQIAPVGGYIMGIPANLSPDRVPAAVEALRVFTSPEAQKLYVQNGSRTNPRYSVGADPDVRCLSPIFEAVDAMSWRDELQFWPRPPVPEINEIIQICGEEFHDMLRGVTAPSETLRRAEERADAVIKKHRST
ncbi:extracellular solute-binding protein [Aliiruegeria lutimaris]|uniref:Carbohydrate ABC transporter substrate-binding protein, CUT1 family n=1 Tax=Aliiruegeria lutimaris TaxID=571298 RepID=A0A1G9KIV4_9RHOB|nr:extracellular solute-binding protein [Aliiruegeria lutimaris]SDL49516.1 carbohydrate ABC transporter substrate-binding protein, CUT1 family [Aliiruegeria lutimaris]